MPKINIGLADLQEKDQHCVFVCKTWTKTKIHYARPMLRPRLPWSKKGNRFVEQAPFNFSSTDFCSSIYTIYILKL